VRERERERREGRGIERGNKNNGDKQTENKLILIFVTWYDHVVFAYTYTYLKHGDM
jgi:hypothetical protein